MVPMESLALWCTTLVPRREYEGGIPHVPLKGCCLSCVREAALLPNLVQRPHLYMLVCEDDPGDEDSESDASSFPMSERGGEGDDQAGGA